MTPSTLVQAIPISRPAARNSVSFSIKEILQIGMNLAAHGKGCTFHSRLHSSKLFHSQGTSLFRVAILGVLTRNKNLELVTISSDGDRNHAVALAAIRTIILFTNKTVNRMKFSGLVVLRIKHLVSAAIEQKNI
jgi:hypothetical protein